MKFAPLALALTLAAPSAFAASLTFNNLGCNGGACTDGDLIDQSYGDMAGVDVIYDADTSTAALDQFTYRKKGYEGLRGAAYSATGTASSITFAANAGSVVIVRRAIIAPYMDALIPADFTVYDMADNSVLFSASENPLSTNGITEYNGRWRSTTGIRLEFGLAAFAAGIDRIRYLATTPANRVAAPNPVPLPAAGFALLAGLGCLAGLRRR